MLDIRLFRENAEIVRQDLLKRRDGEKLAWVDKVIALDKERREAQNAADNIRHERNTLSQQINLLKKQAKNADLELARAKEIPLKLRELEEREGVLSKDINYLLMRLPNITHPSVPYGKDDSENVPVRSWGVPRKPETVALSHGELAEKLGADFTRSTKISGAGFYFLKGQLALLNQALIRYAIEFLVKRGYTYVEPPLIMRRESYQGVTDLADFEKVMYKVEGEESFLIATSEHPLVAQYQDDILDERQLPLKMCGYSMSFRREIGSHGVDTRGLFRTHQFNKVEQVIICRPEDSWALHEELQRNTEELFEGLGLPYRVVNICTGDLGTVAAKKYDTEAWMPKQGAYKEVASCSNCSDYQARRLNIRYRAGQGSILVHTLNNTAIATSRALVAILENYQNADGSLTVPEVLRDLMGGIEVIKPN